MSKDWKEKLTPEQYAVLREKGTEAPFSGTLLNNKEDGMYHCAGCGQALFSSEKKYDSGSGWPSFTDAEDSKYIRLEKDSSFGMTRTAVSCASCGGHLGHVFPDGPGVCGQRYCINSVSLDFQKNKTEQ